MEAYYDASLAASILLREVMKEMHISDPPEVCAKNGKDKQIFKKCKKIIEKRYSDKNYQELMKFFIASFFVDETEEFHIMDEEELNDFSLQKNSYYSEERTNMST